MYPERRNTYPEPLLTFSQDSSKDRYNLGVGMGG